jgi:hypothetical protein
VRGLCPRRGIILSAQDTVRTALQYAHVPKRQIALGFVAGCERHLLVHEFGPQEASLRIHMQAGLHADEAPGCVVLYELADQLTQLQSRGKVTARITLLPAANPIGASQYLVGGLHCGRFDLVSGINFNRDFPDLKSLALEALDQLPVADRHDFLTMKHWVRQHLQHGLAKFPCSSELSRWRTALLELACSADWVLDLHCDQEAITHIYTAPELWPSFQSLAAYLGSEVQLLDNTASKNQGHGAFDTACFRPWKALRDRLCMTSEWGCRAATIELRGQADVSDVVVQRDVVALLTWLQGLGAIAGVPESAAHPITEPRPLEGVESIYAPCAGIFVPEVSPGNAVSAGHLLGKLYDLQTHCVHPLHSQYGGFVFARTRSRAVNQGAELVKIAGVHATRSGPLLSI